MDEYDHTCDFPGEYMPPPRCAAAPPRFAPSAAPRHGPVPQNTTATPHHCGIIFVAMLTLLVVVGMLLVERRSLLDLTHHLLETMIHNANKN